jgi:hypothetical protein
MSTSQKILLPFLVCSIFLLTGALGRQPPPAPPSAPLHFVAVPVDDSPVADKIRKGADFLEEACARYLPARTPWLSMSIWQQWEDKESAYQVTGRLLRAPNERVRLDLDVSAGSAEGKVCLVSDGRWLWHCRMVGNEKPEEQTIELPDASVPALQAARARVFEEQGCTGFVPLLKTLQARLQQRQLAAGLWKGRPVVVLRGTIIPDSQALGEVPADLRSRMEPREAAVYLDAETLWPHRIEWWGSDKAGAPLSLILQMEFRDPVVDHPISPELCAQLFTTGQ